MKNWKRIIMLLLLCSLLFSWGCHSSSAQQPTKNNNTDSFSCTQLNKLCKSKEGAPYVWGAEGPNKFDCSGFIYWLFRERGNPIPRTTARKMWIYFDSEFIEWRDASCNNLIWFTFEQERPKGHVGIVTKAPKFWQAGNSGGVYSRKLFEGSYWVKYCVGCKEVLE